MNVYIDHDLSALIIEGSPTEEQLQRAWADILEECEAVLASPEQITYLRKCAELQKRTLAYNIAVSLISILRKTYVEDFANRLNRILSTSFRFDISNKAQYLHELNRCSNRLREHRIRIDLLEATIQGLLEKNTQELKTPSWEDFQKTLITLSDHAGRELDENIMTAYSYFERLKRYNKWVELKQKETHSLTR